LAVVQTGYQALTAIKLIDYLGAAFLDLFKTEEPVQEQTKE